MRVVVPGRWSVISKSHFCLALFATLLVLCSSAQAEQPTNFRRIGFLDRSTASGGVLFLDVFRQELSKLGWIEGKNVSIEYRFAEGKTDRLPELAADLVRRKVDLIVVSGRAPGLAAKKASSTTPIVMLSFPDPVAAGMVASLARPGGNVTGLAALSPDLITKRLEILTDTLPKLARVGVLRPPEAGASPQMKELRAAAPALKLKLEEIEIDSISRV
jgi:ABC-type uncharacterized transport system substrate-binding protein